MLRAVPTTPLAAALESSKGRSRQELELTDSLAALSMGVFVPRGDWKIWEELVTGTQKTRDMFFLPHPSP